MKKIIICQILISLLSSSVAFSGKAKRYWGFTNEEAGIISFLIKEKNLTEMNAKNFVSSLMNKVKSSKNSEDQVHEELKALLIEAKGITKPYWDDCGSNDKERMLEFSKKYIEFLRTTGRSEEANILVSCLPKIQRAALAFEAIVRRKASSKIPFDKRVLRKCFQSTLKMKRTKLDAILKMNQNQIDEVTKALEKEQREVNILKKSLMEVTSEEKTQSSSSSSSPRKEKSRSKRVRFFGIENTEGKNKQREVSSRALQLVDLAIDDIFTKRSFHYSESRKRK